MKKILIAFMVVMFAVGTVCAEEGNGAAVSDKVSLEGNFCIRGWDSEEFRGDVGSWWEQRLRIGGKIDVAEDVNIQFRMDIGQGAWGFDYAPGSIARPGYICDDMPRVGDSKVDIDRAFLQINRDKWNFTAGQQYMALGVAQVFDANATGAVLAMNFDPVAVALIYAKLDERGMLYDGDEYDDLDGYAINIAYAADTFNANVFYAMAIDGAPSDVSPWALGFNGATTFGMFNFKGELAFLGGDAFDGTVDFTGTQLFIGADAALTESINLGAEFFYAKGADDDEYQLTRLADWNTFTPMSYNTPMASEISGMPSWDVFNPFGNGSGVVGATIFADFAIMDSLSAGCKLGYFDSEDDERLPGADLTSYNLWVKYQLATNTYLTGTYMVSSYDFDNAPEYFGDREVLVGEIIVNF